VERCHDAALIEERLLRDPDAERRRWKSRVRPARVGNSSFIITGKRR